MNVHKQLFDSPFGKVTSIVASQDDFIKIVESMAATFGDHKEQMLKGKHVPLVKRTKETQHVFDTLNINTDYMNICVRGFAKEFVKNLSDVDIDKAIKNRDGEIHPEDTGWN